MSRLFTLDNLKDTLENYIKYHHKNKKLSINYIFNDKLITQDDTINIVRLQEIANDPNYLIAFNLIKKNTVASCSRKGINIPNILSNLIEPFIDYPFNKYLLPLLVLLSGNHISHTNYWSLKIKIKINIESIGEIFKSVKKLKN
jgi:hypothetical protein